MRLKTGTGSLSTTVSTSANLRGISGTDQGQSPSPENENSALAPTSIAEPGKSDGGTSSTAAAQTESQSLLEASLGSDYWRDLAFAKVEISPVICAGPVEG
jgi:hypothetical protein